MSDAMPKELRIYVEELMRRAKEMGKTPPEFVELRLTLTYDEAVAIITRLANLRGHAFEGKPETVESRPKD